MEVVILPTAEDVAKVTAGRLIRQVQDKPGSVLGLATGNTPLGVYEKLVQAYQANEVSFANVTTFNLDEYVGVGREHKGSYAHYMDQHFFKPVGLREDQHHLPNGQAKDLVKECEKYENAISEKGPIDIQLLGIGRDGHIGFNEPGSSFGSRTRLKTLTEVTRQDNRGLFSDTEEIPIHVITMGIGTIMETTEVILMATGDNKAQAVADCVEGPVRARVPASILQFHPKVKIIVDEAAAQQLELKAYYREVFAKKPPWQKAEFI